MKLDSKLDTLNKLQSGRTSRAPVLPELSHVRANGGRLSALAEAISQNPEIEDAYIALLGALRMSPSLVSGNSILVTSTAPGEGKTTIASCLAITSSLAGQAALLVDGDLRRSSLGLAIGITDSVGLTEVLLGETAGADVIHRLRIGQSNSSVVNVMAGGRKSPMILPTMDWAKAKAAFKSVSQDFGIVLVDSPPVLAANDALLLASIVDAILLVVGAGSADLDEVRRAKQQLEQTGTPVIGAVLNRFEPKAHGRSNQPYRSYYRDSKR